MLAAELARHVDFFSIGTNDLVQYTLAVDRGNSRLAPRYNPFHPAVVRLMDHVARAGRAAGIEVAVCGELASHPLGAFLMIGMGAESLSVAHAGLAEIKKVIRSVDRAGAAEAAALALTASTPAGVTEILAERLGRVLDLDKFNGSWTLSRRDLPRSFAPSRIAHPNRQVRRGTPPALHLGVRDRGTSGQDRRPDLRRRPGRDPRGGPPGAGRLRDHGDHRRGRIAGEITTSTYVDIPRSCGGR
jgi:hypothetical protein